MAAEEPGSKRKRPEMFDAVVVVLGHGEYGKDMLPVYHLKNMTQTTILLVEPTYDACFSNIPFLKHKNTFMSDSLYRDPQESLADLKNILNTYECKLKEKMGEERYLEKYGKYESEKERTCTGKGVVTDDPEYYRNRTWGFYDKGQGILIYAPELYQGSTQSMVSLSKPAYLNINGKVIYCEDDLKESEEIWVTKIELMKTLKSMKLKNVLIVDMSCGGGDIPEYLIETLRIEKTWRRVRNKRTRFKRKSKVIL